MYCRKFESFVKREHYNFNKTVDVNALLKRTVRSTSRREVIDCVYLTIETAPLDMKMHR